MKLFEIIRTANDMYLEFSIHDVLFFYVPPHTVTTNGKAITSKEGGVEGKLETTKVEVRTR